MDRRPGRRKRPNVLAFLWALATDAGQSGGAVSHTGVDGLGPGAREESVWPRLFSWSAWAPPATDPEAEPSDFDSLNRLLRGVEWRSSQPIFFQADAYNGTLSNINCTDFAIEDMSVVHSLRANTDNTDVFLDFSSSITSLVAVCVMDLHMVPAEESETGFFSWVEGDFDITGTVSAQVSDGTVISKGTVRGFGRSQPGRSSFDTTVDVDRASCWASVHTEKPTINVSCQSRATGLHMPLCSSILQVVEVALHAKLESMLASELCDKVVNISGSGFSAGAAWADAVLRPWVGAQLPTPRPWSADSAVSRDAEEKRVNLVEWPSNALVRLIRYARKTILTPKFLNTVMEGVAGPGGGLATRVFIPMPLVEQEVRIRAEVEEFVVTGLDTFTLFDPLNEVSDRTLRFSLSIASLRVGAVSSVYIEKVEHSQFAGLPSIVERATVSMGLHDLSINVSIMLGLDRDSVSNVQLGSFANDPEGCSLMSVFAMEVTELSVTVGGITPPNFTGLISPGLDRVLDQLASLTWAAYGYSIEEAVPAAFEMSIRPLLNSALQRLLANRVASLCPEYHAESGQYVKFTGNTSVPRALSYLHNVVHPVSKINDYFAGEVVAQSSSGGGRAGPPGVWRGPTSMNWSSSGDVGPLGHFSIAAGDLRISNLDSFYDVNVLEPNGSYKLVNSLGFAGNRTAVLSLRVLLNISTGQLRVYDDAEVFLILRDLGFFSEALMLIDGGRFLSRTLLSLTDAACWLGSMDEAAMKQLVLASGIFALTAVCEQPASCTSPLMLKADSLMKRPGAIDNLTKMMNAGFARFTDGLTSSHAHEELRKLVQRSNLMCEGQPVPEQLLPASAQASQVRDSTHGLAATVRLFALLALLYVFSICCFPCLRWSRKPSAQVVADSASRGAPKTSRSEERLADGPREKPPLCCDPATPRWQRSLVTTAGVLVVPVLLAGHFTTAAHVGVDVCLGGNAPGTTASVTLKKLSVVQSVLELWRHGAYPLAILIAGFSVVWPYVKLAILAVCWYAPPERIGLRWRGCLLELLDSWGKWSLIDVYVLVLCMVALSAHIANPDLVFAEEGDAYDIKLWVEPSLGLWCFLAAVLVSLGLSSSSIWSHRAATATGPATRHEHFGAVLRPALPVRQPLGGHAWDVPIPEAEGCRLQLSWIGKHLVTAALLLAGALLFVGALSPAIGFVTRGLVGSLLQVMEPGSHHIQHSFVSAPLVLLDPQGLSEKSPVTAGFIVFCYFTFGLMVPLANLGLLSVLWLADLTERNRRRTLAAIKALTSWSVLEVFLFAVTVSLWELASLSRSIADHHCQSIQPVLDLLVPFSLVDVGVCYEVFPEFASGSFLLLTGALWAQAVTFLVVGACEAALADKDGARAGDRNLAALVGPSLGASSFGNKLLVLRFCYHVGLLRAVPREPPLDVEHEKRRCQASDWFEDVVTPLLQ